LDYSISTDNTPDKLCHPTSDAYSAHVLLNKLRSLSELLP